MKFNVNNPAFLQAASHVDGVEKIIMMFSEANQGATITSVGGITVKSIANGVPVENVIDNPSYVSFSSDANTPIIIEGKVTKVNGNPGSGYLEKLIYIDTEMAKSLTSLKCEGCSGMTEINVSKNIQLTDIDLSGTPITSIDISNNKQLESLVLMQTSITSLDVSNNEQLSRLSLQATPIVSLDMSNNPNLTSLNLTLCAELTEIMTVSTNESTSTVVASAITNATSVDGIVTLRQGDEFNQTIIDAAMEKGWDVQYYAN